MSNLELLSVKINYNHVLMLLQLNLRNMNECTVLNILILKKTCVNNIFMWRYIHVCCFATINNLNSNEILAL